MKSKRSLILAATIGLALLGVSILVMVGAVLAGYHPLKLLLGIPERPQRPDVIALESPVLSTGRTVRDGELFICRTKITLGNIGGLPETLQALRVTIGLTSDQQTVLRSPGEEARWRGSQVELLANVWHTEPPPLGTYDTIETLEEARRVEGHGLPAQIDEHGSLAVFVDVVGSSRGDAPESLALGFLFEFSTIRPVSVAGVRCSP